MKLKPRLILVIVLIALTSVAIYVMFLPNKDVNTKANCKDLEKYQSSFGVFNAPHFVLGQVIELNKDSKQAQFIGVIPHQPNEIMEEPRSVGETSIISNAEFVISTDIKLPSSDEANLKSQIQNNTLFVLRNSRRTNLLDAAALVDRNPRVKEHIAGGQSNAIFLIVSALLYADGLNFKLKDARETNEGVQLLKVSNFTIHVKYECQGSLQVRADQGSLFFKATFLKYNPSSRKIETDLSEAVDLRDYNFTLSR
jgi:hypothetical protein